MSAEICTLPTTEIKDTMTRQTIFTIKFLSIDIILFLKRVKVKVSEDAESFKKMGISFVEIKTFPDTEKEITNKSKMSGYFKQDIRPYFLCMLKLKPILFKRGLPRYR